MADEKCDGVAAPEFCSGLTIVSKHPIKNVEFLPFTDHGDFFWDYEYFLRRGAGVVTLEPRPGHTVAVVVSLYTVPYTVLYTVHCTQVTSLASIDYNYWYREHYCTVNCTVNCTLYCTQVPGAPGRRPPAVPQTLHRAGRST